MSEIKLLTPEEIRAVFEPLHKVKLDVSGIRRKFLNCPYGEEPRQVMDIYLPNEGEGPYPVIFFLHGGGWTGGVKSDAQALPFIAGVERGYAVICLTYRLVPHVRYPENLFDVKAALRWTAENAETYLLDTERCALTGASAGAHLAMMAAFTMGQAVFEGAPLGKTCNIRAVVNQFGPTDFNKMHTHYDESGFPRAHDPDSAKEQTLDIMLGARLTELTNMLRFMNPIDNIHPDMPPVLSQHGRYDPMVPYQQATELTERIRAIAGERRAELDIQDGLTHADLGFASPEEIDRIFTFLDKYLK